MEEERGMERDEWKKDDTPAIIFSNAVLFHACCLGSDCWTYTVVLRSLAPWCLSPDLASTLRRTAMGRTAMCRNL